MNKRQVGSGYEEIAAAYLIEHGYQIVDRNFRTRTGEIDLIGRDGEYLVFVEVKYRKDNKKGYPQEAVTFHKQQIIRHTAMFYLYSHHIPEDMPCRFDVVAILGEKITLIQDAF